MTSVNSLVVLALVSFLTLARAQEPKSEEDCKDQTMVESTASDVLQVTAAMQESCPPEYESKLANLCSSVADQSKASSSSPYLYKYEEILSEAACVKTTDSKEIANKKINRLWTRNEKKYMKCSKTNFSVIRGSILKYAIEAKMNNGFIEKVVKNWKINLNIVDDSDNRTVLDFIQDQIKQYDETTSIGKRLKGYYTLLKANGAKHKSEL